MLRKPIIKRSSRPNSLTLVVLKDRKRRQAIVEPKEKVSKKKINRVERRTSKMGTKEAMARFRLYLISR